MNSKAVDFNLFSISIKPLKPKLMKTINDYTFYYISDMKDIQPIFKKIQNSNLILVNYYLLNCYDGVFIVGLKESIIIFTNSLLASLKPILSNNPNTLIYFLPNTKESFCKYINIQNHQYECDDLLLEGISSINKEIIIKQISGNNIYKNIGSAISSCISGYLILQGYNLINKNQKNISLNMKLNENDQNIKIFNNNDFIILREIDSGSLSKILLIYEIENKELFVLKRVNNENDLKFNKREYENYININYPLLPKLYGKVADNDYLIIQFINGKTLVNIENFHFSFSEKISIITQIMLSINYLHKKEFVYRDLKPTNIMIDENKTVYIIDFDRMLKSNELKNDIDQTREFTIFAAPEISLGKADYKSDIYSIGKMIYYIMTEKYPENLNDAITMELQINKIYKKCISDEINNRPSINDLLFEFCTLYLYILDEYPLISNSNEITYIKGIFYLDYKYITKNIDDTIHYLKYLIDNNYLYASFILSIIYKDKKLNINNIDNAIHYLSLAADRNLPRAQLALGEIYLYGYYNKKDTNKAIHYLSLAANQSNAQYYLGFIKEQYIESNKSLAHHVLSMKQSHPEAQFMLACHYFENKHNKCDIDKSIHYLTLAANQNHSNALYALADLYFEGKYIEKNINKAINYYELSASQNNQYAQYKLALIYEKGKNIQKDIEKAIYYYTLAANQNHFEALFHLGKIYAKGEYIKKDIKKAIHYLEIAANHDNKENYIAQCNLGLIYDTDNDITRDINKAIHYYELSANHHYANAQYNLAQIYENDKKNIEKAIYYYSLAANQNHFEALIHLGKIYAKGEYIEKDIKKAIHYLEIAANHDNDQNYIAQFNLGLIYDTDNDITRDINKAIHYYELSANHNYARAQYNLAQIYENDKTNIEKAIYYYSLAANQNHSGAKYNLGFIYFYGKYVKQDINKAIQIFATLENENCPDVNYAFAILYFEGIHVRRNIKKVMHYLTRAAEQNFPQAQYVLGMMYEEGKYIDRDINKAIYYYSMASNQNDYHAQIKLGLIYLEGKFILKNVDKAIHLFKLSANKNYDISQYILGQIYLTEEYHKQDITKSIHYFTLSADQNNSEAQFKLGIIYYHGYLVKQDIHKAIHYFSLSADQNNPYSQYYLGNIYCTGKYIKYDKNKSIHYLTLAANKNLPEAQFRLGFYCLLGIFSNIDINKGVRYIINSSENGFKKAHFIVGYFLHDGLYITHDIKKSISYYKKASSLNSKYAKNNLGIIYKNGFENEIPKHIGKAIDYFEEAINRWEDELSMYNLSHIYIYEDSSIKRIDESINFLIKLSKTKFVIAKPLLCIALIIKNKFDIQKIKHEIFEKLNHSSANKIYEMIISKKLCKESFFNEYYIYYKNIDYLYDFMYLPKKSSDLHCKIRKNTQKNITSDFYQGFDLSI